MQDYIFVRLLHEGTTVYRPVKAFSKQEDIYFIDNTVLLDYQDEEWEFKPGSYVHVNREFLANGEYIVAGKEFFFRKNKKDILINFTIQNYFYNFSSMGN